MKLLLYTFGCSELFVTIYHVFVNVDVLSRQNTGVTCDPNTVRKTHVNPRSFLRRREVLDDADQPPPKRPRLHDKASEMGSAY